MAYQNYQTETFENLSRMLACNAERFGDKTAFLEKRDGAFQPYSFRRFEADVTALGAELCARGFAGKRILLTGRNSYAWAVAYMATVCFAGTVIPADKDLPAEDLAEIARLSGAAAVIYDGRAEEDLAALPAGLKKIPFAELPDLIRAGGEKGSAKAVPDDGASVLIFSTLSKGVLLSQKNLCFSVDQFCKMIRLTPRDVSLSILPLHYSFECVSSFLAPFSCGCTVAFSEGLHYATADMQEVHPTVLGCVPYLAETMYRKVWANIRRQGLEKSTRARIRATGALRPASVRMLAKRRSFAEVHKSFGGKLRLMIVGGASVDPEVLSGFRDFGILAVQCYSLTECGALAALNRDTSFRDDSAGMSLPDSLLDIYDMQDDGSGEIRYKGGNVMLGYLDRPEQTEKVLKDGWFYTGDLGFLDRDGFLHIIGRKKNVIVLSNRKKVFPEELEALLCRNPFIREAVVVGILNPEKKNYDVVAVLVPDLNAFKEKFGEKPAAQQVDGELRRAVAEVNSAVAPHKQIVSFLLRNEDFPKNTARKIIRDGIASAAEREYLQK